MDLVRVWCHLLIGDVAAWLQSLCQPAYSSYESSRSFGFRAAKRFMQMTHSLWRDAMERVYPPKRCSRVGGHFFTPTKSGTFNHTLNFLRLSSVRAFAHRSPKDEGGPACPATRGLPFVRRSGRPHASVTLVGVCTNHPRLPFGDEIIR